MASTYSPNASLAPSRTLSRAAGSYCTHLASYFSVNFLICSCSDGDVIVSVNTRMPDEGPPDPDNSPEVVPDEEPLDEVDEVPLLDDETTSFFALSPSSSIR